MVATEGGDGKDEIERLGGLGWGVGWGWGAGMRPKKAYISKTTEPNLKNEYVLESA